MTTPTPLAEAIERLEHDLQVRALFQDEDGAILLKVREDDLRTILSALLAGPPEPTEEELVAVLHQTWIDFDDGKTGASDPEDWSVSEYQAEAVQALYRSKRHD